MSETSTIEKLFDTLLNDEFEKQITHLISESKDPEEIIEILVNLEEQDSI